jgi:hypothetical protein
MVMRGMDKARTWRVPCGAAVTLCMGCWSPSRGAEGRDTCKEQGEIVAIYDCQSGLVLWSRQPPGQTLPTMPPGRQLCRLTSGQGRSPADERCL